MTRNRNNEASSSKSSKTSDDNMKPSSWPHLNHDLLSSIMMQLGLIDYLAFSGVCKSWRSLAHSERNSFMSSHRPMSVSFSKNAKKECYLHDYEGRTFKTILPRSTGRKSVGSTCGYFIFFGRKSREFCLVNPVTKHELHFPGFPFYVSNDPANIRGVLVFSPSMSGWVFVISLRFSSVISFSVPGNQPSWNNLSFNFPILDLQHFKGKLYAISSKSHLYEVKLNPKPSLTPLEMKNEPPRTLIQTEFLSSGENLYVVNCIWKGVYETREIDFEKMEWVSAEKTIREFAVFVCDSKSSWAINPETWMQREKFGYIKDADESKKHKGRWFAANLWYFPHDCMNDNMLH